MAYDAATRTAVLFSTEGLTWTWNGRTWTKQHPTVHPPARALASMAYDAATRTVVLFGGLTPSPTLRLLADTWTWDGTTWTQQHPKVHPSARDVASMADDGATGNVVLFGGALPRPDSVSGGTWTWDGTTWTKQHPATSPPARSDASMAYDAATGTVVLFGGCCTKLRGPLDDTWTWNGTTWIQQHPATSPLARYREALADDGATGTVVLFGGAAENHRGNDYLLGDTWTWDGTTWTKQHPKVHPSNREFMSMADDAATGTVVLFGGITPNDQILADTWTWG
jgi:hypothetical protein